jgi:hypothetical protein
MATEAQVSTAIVRGLELCGHFAHKASDKYTAGVVDILGVYSALPALADERVRALLPQIYAGRSVAIETKIVKALPKRGGSKVLQHELSRAQFKFLEAVNDRGGLAYVALAVPRRRPGVDVHLITFDAWDYGSEGMDGKNVTLDWLVLADESNSWKSSRMRGNLTKGFLASAGPLEATFK